MSWCSIGSGMNRGSSVCSRVASTLRFAHALRAERFSPGGVNTVERNPTTVLPEATRLEKACEGGTGGHWTENPSLPLG